MIHLYSAHPAYKAYKGSTLAKPGLFKTLQQQMGISGYGNAYTGYETAPPKKGGMLKKLLLIGVGAFAAKKALNYAGGVKGALSIGKHLLDKANLSGLASILMQKARDILKTKAA